MTNLLAVNVASSRTNGTVWRRKLRKNSNPKTKEGKYTGCSRRSWSRRSSWTWCTVTRYRETIITANCRNTKLLWRKQINWLRDIGMKGTRFNYKSTNWCRRMWTKSSSLETSTSLAPMARWGHSTSTILSLFKTNNNNSFVVELEQHQRPKAHLCLTSKRQRLINNLWPIRNKGFKSSLKIKITVASYMVQRVHRSRATGRCLTSAVTTKWYSKRKLKVTYLSMRTYQAKFLI